VHVQLQPVVEILESQCSRIFKFFHYYSENGDDFPKVLPYLKGGNLSILLQQSSCFTATSGADFSAVLHLEGTYALIRGALLFLELAAL
jgi:hypothetical protein